MSMRHILSGLCGIVWLSVAQSALAQRAEENAVRSAEDAFGATVGRESIGLYSPDDVRGFSAVVAGNLRIDGLYFDQQEAPTSHLVAGETIRVGLAAQGFAFPAPTGIVDYQLRVPGDAVTATVAERGTGWGSASLEADAQLPVTSTLSLGLGGGAYHDIFGDRTYADYLQAAAIARWRPIPGVEIVPFAEYAPVLGNPAPPVYLTAEGSPPAQLPRAYLGPAWTLYRGTNVNAGAVASAGLGHDTTLRVGAFHSSGTSSSTFAQLLVGLTPDGLADRIIIADPPRSYVSNSGEVRLAHGFAEGPRRHLLVASVRGRMVDSRYGGSDTFDFGETSIFADAPRSEPPPDLGERTSDRVRQWFAGLSYTMSWAGVGEASVSLLKTDYRKRVAVPGAKEATAQDAPILWNASVAINLADTLVVYASHTTGLEEAGAAPDVAINRNSLSPAIRTRQSDLGLRFRPSDAVTLIAGVFELTKPYDAVDAAGLFGPLGDLRNRGAEVSLTARRGGWTVVAGGVLLDAVISGPAVAQRLVGHRPVGSTPYKLQANVEWAPSAAPRWSFDLAAAARGNEVVTTDSITRLPPHATVDVGLRYRVPVGRTHSVIRAQIANLLGAGGYVVLAPGAYKLADDRQAILSLSTDL